MDVHREHASTSLLLPCCHDPSALTACFLTRVEWRRGAVWSALGQVPGEGAGGVCPFTPSLRPSLPGLAVDCSVHHTGGHRCSPRVGGRGSKFVPHLMLILTSSVKQSARTLTPGPAVPVRALCVRMCVCMHAVATLEPEPIYVCALPRTTNQARLAMPGGTCCTAHLPTTALQTQVLYLSSGRGAPTSLGGSPNDLLKRAGGGL